LLFADSAVVLVGYLIQLLFACLFFANSPVVSAIC